MPALKATHLTKRSVDALKPGETIWDDEARGFAFRCQRQRKMFVLRFRAKGRQQWLAIGEYGAPWTVQTARVEAQRMLTAIRDGTPVEALRNTGTGQPTMADLCVRFLEEHSFENKRQSNARTDAANIANHVEPLLGRINVRDVTRSGIEQFKKAIRNGKTAVKDADRKRHHKGGAVVTGGLVVANRCLALLSKMFNLAEIWGWREEYTNPVRLVSKYAENQPQRFLSDHEIAELGEILDQCELDGFATPHSIAAIRLLLLTGARLSEILTAEWRNVDLDRGYLSVP